MNQFLESFTDLERGQIIQLTALGKRRKLWNRLSRRHEVLLRAIEGRIVNMERRREFKKKMLEIYGPERKTMLIIRGRRAKNAQCPVCEEFYRKIFKTFRRKNKEGYMEKVLRLSIDCRHHGKAIIQDKVIEREN